MPCRHLGMRMLVSLWPRIQSVLARLSSAILLGGKMVAHCRFKLMFSVMGSLFPFCSFLLLFFCPIFLLGCWSFSSCPCTVTCKHFFFSVCHYLLTQLVCMCFTMFEFMIFGFWVIVRIQSSLWGWVSELLNFLHGISILIFFFFLEQLHLSLICGI